MIVNKLFNSTPLLPNDDIIEFLVKNFNLLIDVQILRNPDCDNIYGLYSKIFDRANIIKIDNTNKIIFAGLCKLSYPGLHDTSIFLMKFYKQMKKFMDNVLFLNDFQSSDIFQPEPKRTR